MSIIDPFAAAGGGEFTRLLKYTFGPGDTEVIQTFTSGARVKIIMKGVYADLTFSDFTMVLSENGGQTWDADGYTTKKVMINSSNGAVSGTYFNSQPVLYLTDSSSISTSERKVELEYIMSTTPDSTVIANGWVHDYLTGNGQTHHQALQHYSKLTPNALKIGINTGSYQGGTLEIWEDEP